MQKNCYSVSISHHIKKHRLFQTAQTKLILLLLTLLTILHCGSEWCDFEIVTVERNATITNLTGSTIRVKYAINRYYERTCCCNERKIPTPDFETRAIDIANGSSMTWTYSYWDSSECAKSITVLPGDNWEIDTVFVTSNNKNDTIFWPIDTSYFSYETDGWVRWVADSGTVINDTLVMEWKDSLVYGYR